MPQLTYTWKATFDQAMAGDGPTLKRPHVDQASPDGQAVSNVGGDWPLFFGFHVSLMTNRADLAPASVCKISGPRGPGLGNAMTAGEKALIPDLKFVPEGYSTEIFKIVSEIEPAFTETQLLDMTAWDPALADRYDPAQNGCLYQVSDMLDNEPNFHHQNVDMMGFRPRGETETEIMFGGPRAFYGNPKPGVWSLLKEGQPIAKFDHFASAAFETVEIAGTPYRKPLVFVPAIQIVKAPGTEEVESMRVRFYQYHLDEANPAASDYETVPMGVVAKFVNKFTVFMNNGDPVNDISAAVDIFPLNLDPAATSADATHPNMRAFAFPPLKDENGNDVTFPAGKEQISSMVVEYEMFGNKYGVRMRCTDHTGVIDPAKNINCKI